MAYIRGNRNQNTLFPPAIEDYVGAEDPVRAYDAFVENVEFQEMGFVINPYKVGALWISSKDALKINRLWIFLWRKEFPEIGKSMLSQSFLYVVSIWRKAWLPYDSEISQRK